MRRAGDQDAHRVASSPSITDPAVLRGVMTKKNSFLVHSLLRFDKLWEGDVRGGQWGCSWCPPSRRGVTDVLAAGPLHTGLSPAPGQSSCGFPQPNPHVPGGQRSHHQPALHPHSAADPALPFCRCPLGASEGPQGCQGTSPAPNWHRGHGSSLP